MSRPSAARKAPKGEYIETDSGNKVWRKANISGAPNITLGGRTVIREDVHLRGDLHRLSTTKEDGSKSSSSHSISIGRCSVVAAGCVIKPPCRVSRGVLTYYPMKIGDNVFIGPNSTIQSASISSHVHIGEHCVLQPFSMVRENVKILPHTIVPANMVIPSNSVVGGRPARIIGEVGEGWGAAGGASAAGGAGTGGESWVEGGDLRELVRSIR
ncbi:trimeric LpxA-like protein [Rhizodiscina lignyota]|uniref:Dynactin subunit 5 n=1 Tax=Rhizodiscina lignyota TaxID=1504668 RepID=A0A9P4M9F7_9PEZI|nr:trimeric LpxA-like protein [Rhizodiscina lignyota]